MACQGPVILLPLGRQLVVWADDAPADDEHGHRGIARPLVEVRTGSRIFLGLIPEPPADYDNAGGQGALLH